MQRGPHRFMLALLLGHTAATAAAAPLPSLRNLRYWAADRLPIRYEMDAPGDPRIVDGSEYAAVAQAFAAWTSVPGAVLSVATDAAHQGLSVAVSGDGRNTVTFSDPDGVVPGLVGMAVVTSVTADTVIAGRLFHPGEIVDADILFNATGFSFSTPSFAGTADAYDLRSVATHELGHLLGLAHSCIGSSTLYWALPHGTAFATLQDDDRALAQRNYGAPALAVSGRILRGNAADPVPGAAVIAIATNGDTLQMTVSRENGSYDFYGLGRDCRVYVLPIDGSPDVGRLVPSAVNSQVGAIAATDFLPEYWDGPNETNHDFGTGGTVARSVDFPVTHADILVNDDTTPPHVVAVTPPDGAAAIPATTGIGVKFDDRILRSSVGPATVALRVAASGALVAAAAGLLQADSLVFVTPSGRPPLLPSTRYRLEIGPGIRDRFGNVSNTVFTSEFTTAPAPALALTAASPAEVAVGSTLVLTGAGFDLAAQSNRVFFGAVETAALVSTVDRLYVVVPPGATGDVHVETAGARSGDLHVRIVAPRAVPVLNRLGHTDLGSEAGAVVIGPEARFAYVATLDGIEVIGADPAFPGEFLRSTLIPVPGGCTAAVAMPGGKRVLAIGPQQPRLRAFDADPGSLNRNGAVADTSLAEVPLGIEVVPGGNEVLVVFASRVALFGAGVNSQFGLELRQWADSTLTFHGELAVAPDAGEAYATTTDGRIAVLGMMEQENIVATLLSGITPGEVGALPSGSGVVSVDAGGSVRRAGARGPTRLTLGVGGGFRGLAVSPEGDFAYAANFTLNRVDVLDLRGGGLRTAGDVPTGPDPRDIAAGNGGRYVYVVTRIPNRFEVFDTEGALRTTSVVPQSGGPGTLITIVGSGFDPVPANNIVDIGGTSHTPAEVSPDGTRLLVRQSPAAAPGVLRVIRGDRTSNAVTYDVQNRPDPGRYGQGIGPPLQFGLTLTQLCMSPDGRLLFATNLAGELLVIRAEAGQIDLHAVLQWIAAADAHLISAQQIAVTPDGRTLYIADRFSGIQVYEIDPATNWVRWSRALVPALVHTPASVAVTPDGHAVYVAADSDSVFGYAAGTDSLLLRWRVKNQQVAVHPDGHTLYAGGTGLGAASIGCLAIGNGGTSGSIPLPGSFRTFVLRPDGRRMYVCVAKSAPAPAPFGLLEVDVDPQSPTRNTVLQDTPLAALNTPDLAVNHSGTLLFVRRPGEGYAALALQPVLGAAVYTASGSPNDVGLHLTVVSQDDARLYNVGGPVAGMVEILPLTPESDVEFEGSGLRSAAPREWAAPAYVLRVNGAPGNLLRGTLVQLSCAGGTFWGEAQTIWATADGTGQVRATLRAEQTPGTYVVGVEAASPTPEGQFTVGEDTTFAAVRVLAVVPAGPRPVSVYTNAIVDFSRALDAATSTPAAVFLRPQGGAPVETRLALTDRNRRIVLTPRAELAPNTQYEVITTALLRDQAGNALVNPGVSPFVTGDPPPLLLASVQPRAARPGDPVVIAGTGFAAGASANRVFFGGVEATPRDGNVNSLTVVVPYDAASGDVHVETGGRATNGVAFTVLPPPSVPLTSATATVNTPASCQRIAIVPDGSRAYMTSPGPGTVVPLRITDRVIEPAIGVGAYPFAIAISPDGKEGYTANFHSNDVTVFGTQPGTPEFQNVLATIPVGLNPAGIAVSPDGARVYVVNYGDSTFTILDTSSHDAARYGPVGGGSTGTMSQAIAVTPDGRIILGTPTGIRILRALDGQGVADARTSSTTTAVAVTPDGGFAVVLSADNSIHLIDLRPNSDSPYQGVADARTSSTTTAVAVTPDGGFVYVTHTDGSIEVFSIAALVSGGKAVRPGGSLHATYEFRLVATFRAGENPTAIAFDPGGAGTAVVVNSGSNSVTLLGLPAAVPACVQFSPRKLRPGPGGGDVTVKLQFDPSVSPADVAAASVVLNGTVHVARDLGVRSGRCADDEDDDDDRRGRDDARKTDGAPSGADALNDDRDGRLHGRVRVFTFDRQAVLATLPQQGQTAVIRITGRAGTRLFAGETTIRIRRPQVRCPHAGDRWAAGQLVHIQWAPVEGAQYVGIYVTDEDGRAPQTVALQTADDGDYAWVVAGTSSRRRRVWIVAYDAQGALGTGASEGTFTILQASDVDALPERFEFAPASTNPFAHGMSFALGLPAGAPVDFSVYTVDGRRVARICMGAKYPAGRHVLRWDGRGDDGHPVAAGVYFAVLQAGPWSAREKIVRIR